MIPIIILILAVLTIIITFGYQLIHVRKDLVINENGTLPTSDFVSTNGCGRMVLGGYEIENLPFKIYYVTFTLFYIPIIPLKCIVAIDNGGYQIYNLARMSFTEILACFFNRYAWISIVGVIIYYLST